MNPEFYYITEENPTVKVPLKAQNEIDLRNRNLIESVLPESKYIYCSGNYLTELIIPEGCIYVNCENNNLTKLIIPKNCKQVWCYGNNLHPIIKTLLESANPIKIELANNLQIANNLQR